MTEHELKQQGDKYKEARDYKELLLSPAFMRYQEGLKRRIEEIMQEAILKGFESNEVEHDKLVEARVLQRLIELPESIAKSEESLRIRLESAGVTLDSTL